jgi:hypothetical protein
MVLFCMYIFNRHGACLFYEEWHRRYHAQVTREDDQLLMFGLLFSLREMTIRSLPAPHVIPKACVPWRSCVVEGSV